LEEAIDLSGDRQILDLDITDVGILTYRGLREKVKIQGLYTSIPQPVCRHVVSRAPRSFITICIFVPYYSYKKENKLN
jgi:hypothetical protein